MALICTTTNVDFNDQVNTFLQSGIDFGETRLTAAGEGKYNAGMSLSDYDYEKRTISFDVMVKAETEEEVEVIAQEIIQELAPYPSLPPIGEMTFNTGGWPSNRIIRYYRGRSSVSTTLEVGEQAALVRFLKIDLICEPFFYGDLIYPEKNIILDPLMIEDNNGNTVCNSWSWYSDSTAHTHIDGGQMIDMTGASAANKIATVYSDVSSVTAGTKVSFSIEYKTRNTAPTNCKYNIYATFAGGGSGVSYLLQDSITPKTDWEFIKLENITVPAGATNVSLAMEIKSTSSGATGQLWCRKALCQITSALKTNPDNGYPIFIASDVANSPATFCIGNVPGDVDANCILQVKCKGLHNYEAQPDIFIMGQSKMQTNCQTFVYKFNSDTSTYAMGGKCDDRGSYGSFFIGTSGMWDGEYLVVARVKTSSTSYATDAIHIEQSTTNTFGGSPYILPSVTPFGGSGKDSWAMANLGVITLPWGGGDYFDAGSSIDLYYTGGSGGTGYSLDYVAFIPIDSGFLETNVGDSSDYDYIAVTSNNISINPNFYLSSHVTAFNNTDPSGRVMQSVYRGEPFTLRAGDTYFNILANNYVGDASQQYWTTSGAEIAITIQPKYIL